MNKLNADNFPELICKRPEKIIQFGEGNFIRAFMDWIIQQLNNQNKFNGSVASEARIPREVSKGVVYSFLEFPDTQRGRR